MAAATSSPELFINLVGTFVTEGDIGVGAVVGSAVFNILAVPACCGLFAGSVSIYCSRDGIRYITRIIAILQVKRNTLYALPYKVGKEDRYSFFPT